MNRANPGTGIGRTSASDEAFDMDRIMKAWDERQKRAKGKAIGTRTLGAEFKTVAK